jgi:hypothetical protein
LPMLQGRSESAEGSPKLNLTLTPLVDEPSPKLDQHESSHSCLLHVNNDACFNMMKCMT